MPWALLPLVILQSALTYAAGTIKNPNSKTALYLKEAIYLIFQQAKITYSDDPRFR